MILFDYGQTLVNEASFDGVKGTAAVMKYAVANKYNKTPEQVQAEANAINAEIGRFDPETRHLSQLEVPTAPFNAYLYESMGISLSVTYEEAGRIFWDAAAPGAPANGIEAFLDYLKDEGIRSGVVSNLSYSGAQLKERIVSLISSNELESVISSADYVFRKPNRRIFELALKKAELKAEQVWFVGDQYRCDIYGAIDAGMFPVWYTEYLNFPQRNEHGVLEVKSYGELKEILVKCDEV